jgi:hypothetical protein
MVLVQRPLVQRAPRVQRAPQVAQPVQREVVRRTWRLVGLDCGPGMLCAGCPYQMVDGEECLQVDNGLVNLTQWKREANVVRVDTNLLKLCLFLPYFALDIPTHPPNILINAISS